MKTLCFALILSQSALENSAPPPHIQDLLKKRVLYQIKQADPEREFSFDEATCSVVGSYEYSEDALKIFTADKAIDLEIPYTDILSGKKLELTSIHSAIDSRANIVAAATTHYEPIIDSSTYHTENSGSRKWIPWAIAGAVGLVAGGYLIYQSQERKGGESPPPARRPR